MSGTKTPPDGQGALLSALYYFAWPAVSTGLRNVPTMPLAGWVMSLWPSLVMLRYIGVGLLCHLGLRTETLLAKMSLEISLPSRKIVWRSGHVLFQRQTRHNSHRLRRLTW